MNDWMEGYNSDIDYTIGYYEWLSPHYLTLCAVSAGIKPIDINSSFTYCELGCGQGFTILVNASLFPQATFYAVDFNPSHIAFAKDLAKELKLTNIHFLENSFQDLIDNPTLLPQVDFMVFHGIYSWVNDENRANLIELCKRHLSPGGMVYNSYNVKPGWSVGEVIQQLMWRLSQEYGGSSIDKIDNIIIQIEKLLELNMGYFKLNASSLSKLLERIKKSDKRYVVHEYMHESWKAFYFPEVAKEMEKAKLSYLSQADIANTYMKNIIPSKLNDVINNINESYNKELIEDITANRSFRKDIYVRGVRKHLSDSEKLSWFIDKEWVLINPNIPEKFEFTLSVGKAEGDKKIYLPIIECLQKGIYSTKKIQETTKLKYSKIIQALIMLYSNNIVAIYSKQKKSKAVVLNRYIINNAFKPDSIKYIILPNMKVVLKLDLFHFVWLNGLYKGLTTPEQLVKHAYNVFKSKGIAISYKGKTLEGEDALNRLKELETKWREKVLPLWKQAGVI